MTDFNHIFIFKSNIKTEADKYCVKDLLDLHPLIEQWSIDLDDEDHVLRIVSHTLDHNKIVDLIKCCGYMCEELNN